MTNAVHSPERNLLNASAKLFLKHGYNKTSVKHITEKSQTDISELHSLGGKEMLLHRLVESLFHHQTEIIQNELKGKSADEVYFCGVWLALLQYITEVNDTMRELFIAEFTLPVLSEKLYYLLQTRHETAFEKYLRIEDRTGLYELEIAAVGVIRSYFTVACSTFFTIGHKANRVIDAVFRIYHVPEEKITETQNFVSQLDLETMAAKALEKTLTDIK